MAELPKSAAPAPPGAQGPPSGGSRAGAPAGRNIFLGLAIALVVVLLAGAAVRAGARPDPGSQGWNGTLLDEASDRPAFTLVDTAGVPFDFASATAGKLTLLFFGYTNCPDVCPITLTTLDGALASLDGVDPAVVFVTTDPARDTPEVLRAYLDRFNTQFIGLTGTPEQVAAAQRAAGVTEAVDDGPNRRGGYDIGHSAQVIAYTPDDKGHLVYGFGVRQDEWAADLARIRATREWWP